MTRPRLISDLATRICFAVLALAATFTLNGCAASNTAASANACARRPAAINHLAFFTLKDEGDADELIADCDRMLGTLPMVESYFCGRHLDTGRGARVDSNYHVGFYVGFADTAAYQAYLDHPSHTAMLAKWQPQWQSIRVIDVADWSP